MGSAQVRDEAGEPGEQAEVHGDRRRDRTGGRGGGRIARRARLQRRQPLHPGQPPPRAQHRGAGRHQRREELPERRRQRLSPLLRHDQGRRLPGARGQRLPARAAERQHHRPVRRAGRAVRARVRRAPRQSIVRRGAGVAHLLRARPDRPAAAPRRLPVADAPGAGKDGPPSRETGNARSRPRQRQGPRHHRQEPGDRGGSSDTPATPSSSPPAGTARRITSRPTR